MGIPELVTVLSIAGFAGVVVLTYMIVQAIKEWSE